MVLVFLTACIAMQAQVSISGTVTDRDTKEGIEQVTVQLLRGDSTFVKGTLTNESGAFSIDNVDDGRYIVKLSSVGYQPYCKDVRVKGGKTIDLGTLVMGADAIMLKATTVTAQAQKVILREDTFVYNADAYRTPEGSVVEELVKKLPGATVDESGKITINGKEVKKILVDGKEFMTGDTKTAMKNLPTSIIQSIKAYDEKSDMARVTGVDDGEEETVLDFGIKRGMNKGLMMNADVAAGTKHRYAERLMVGVMKDDIKVMGFGNANNTNDQGFPGGGGGGRFGAGKNGLNSSKMLGVNIGYEKKKKLEINGNVRWNHNDGDIYSFQATKNFVGGDVTSHSNSLNQKYSRGNQWNSRFKIEWKPDTMTNILFRPSFSYSSNDGNDGQDSKTWDAVDILNSKLSRSTTYSDSKNLGGMLQINRKLNTKGRNVTLRTEANYSDGDSKNNLYSNDLIPERFGRRREYALGKNSGRANIAKNLEELGLELTPEQTRRVTERITELGDKKELVTQDDLPYIVSDVLKHNAPEDKVKLVSYMVSTSYGLKPLASIKVEINGQQYEADSTGDGQYDAFVKALRLIYKNYLGRTFPLLDNYSVSIPPGGRTDALVQTIITWRNGDKLLRTRGLDADQTEAAIKATFKMLNIFESGE